MADTGIRGRMSGQMKIPFVNNIQAIFIAIGLIILAMTAMSFVSYRYTVGRENLAEISMVQNNQRLAMHYIDVIEQRIVQNDGTLFDMVDVNEPSQWPSMAEAIKQAGLNVAQVYFLYPESDYPIFPPYSYEIRDQWQAFRNSFKVKELKLNELEPYQLHHLHKERPDTFFFASYMLMETNEGNPVLVCFQMDFDKIVALLDRHLRDLKDRFYVSVVDFENNGVYGYPISRTTKYFYETRFPGTFYKWILQLVPRNYTELELGVRNRRRTNMLFIVFSMLLIFFSLSIIYFVWRRDLQLRQLKDNFISNVSHELKTPLSLIRMFSELLVLGRVKEEEKRQEYFRIIHNESDRMSRLISNLLDFASLASGVQSRYFEKTSLGQLVNESLEAYRYEIQKNGFSLEVDIEPGMPDSYMDPNAIKMALINLLDNSIKYSLDRREIGVHVGREDGWLELSVADKGIGIPISEQNKIFDKFYRVNDPSIRRIRGNGIGLAITDYVARMHGGKINVESEPGNGSVFTLVIPIRDAPDEQHPKP